MPIQLTEIVGKDVTSLAEAREMPEFSKPMLATLTKKRFSHPDWIFERKFDGERCVAICQGSRIRLMSRNRTDVASTYPEIAEELAGAVKDDLIVDGEIVAFEGNATSFSRLQQRMHIANPRQARESGVAVYFYLFDLPYVGGYDITRLPLRARKTILSKVIDFNGHIRFSQHRNELGESFFNEACESGWEGVIAKKADSVYRHSRSTDWLKFKCVRRQELVIGGFTDPQGSRTGFGALLLGHYDDGELRYAGKVGTGFDEAMLEHLSQRLASIQTREAPFAEAARLNERSIHWVKPELVGEVEFTEWTSDGRLRHPSFLGLRRDKSPRDVRREG